DDLLHHGREHPDDGIDRVHGADPGDADDDAPGAGGGERDGEQQRRERDVHDRAAGGDADVQSGGRDVHRVGPGDADGQHAGGDDLLHDRWEYPDDGVDRVHGADSGDADDDAPGAGGGGQDGEQQRGERDVHDRAAGGDPDVQPGGGDVYRVGPGDADGRHAGGDDLLHNGREHPDDGIDRVHGADPGDADDDAPGASGGERDGEQQRGERHVHDRAAGGDADVQSGGGDVYRVGPGDADGRHA